jgi:hypothetical protein
MRGAINRHQRALTARHKKPSTANWLNERQPAAAGCEFTLGCGGGAPSTACGGVAAAAAEAAAALGDMAAAGSSHRAESSLGVEAPLYRYACAAVAAAAARALLVPLLDLLGRLLLDEVVVREAALRRGPRLLLEVAHHLGVHASGVAHVTVTVAACLRAEQEVRLVEEATGLRHGGESGFRIGKRKPVTDMESSPVQTSKSSS